MFWWAYQGAASMDIPTHAVDIIHSDFRSGKISILIGSSKISAGMNFPGVRRVIKCKGLTITVSKVGAEERERSMYHARASRKPHGSHDLRGKISPVQGPVAWLKWGQRSDGRKEKGFMKILRSRNWGLKRENGLCTTFKGYPHKKSSTQRRKSELVGGWGLVATLEAALCRNLFARPKNVQNGPGKVENSALRAYLGNIWRPHYPLRCYHTDQYIPESVPHFRHFCPTYYATPRPHCPPPSSASSHANLTPDPTQDARETTVEEVARQLEARVHDSDAYQGELTWFDLRLMFAHRF
ncbi:hypothetical protein B0H14DRAFT_3640937 [Mycena olivaceomarginata]|nr:hypothetical protein B0H14DRAFT_3640937 [Mycena olivaceomarginata]